jgi:hypothetical protein
MTIKHKCGDEIVSNSTTRKTENRSSYSEHAEMHYEGGGWFHWTEITYTVSKSIKCGKSHFLKESELL